MSLLVFYSFLTFYLPYPDTLFSLKKDQFFSVEVSNLFFFGDFLINLFSQ